MDIAISTGSHHVEERLTAISSGGTPGNERDLARLQLALQELAKREEVVKALQMRLRNAAVMPLLHRLATNAEDLRGVGSAQAKNLLHPIEREGFTTQRETDKAPIPIKVGIRSKVWKSRRGLRQRSQASFSPPDVLDERQGDAKAFPVGSNPGAARSIRHPRTKPRNGLAASPGPFCTESIRAAQILYNFANPGMDLSLKGLVQ